MSALAARGVCKSFGRHKVLAGLDIDVTSGELVAVVGENGSGKTTLLRVLAGDLRADAGSVACLVVLRLRMPHAAGAAAYSA